MRRFLTLFLFGFSCVATTATAAPGASRTVRVLVPDADNLQYMSFWVARAGGFFEKEGVEVETVSPPGPQQTLVFFERREAEVAVLPPPVFLSLVADGQPVVLVASLLANDPIDLVVRRDVAVARGVTKETPLHDRLAALRGLRIGVAPHPPPRLRALFASAGLDADKDIQMVILHGKEQNGAFARREVDGLYAHTPYLEHSIVADDAVVVVEQTRGEIPSLSNRVIHGLAFTRRLLDEDPDLASRMTRAIDAAERSIHASPKDTVATLARAFPKRDVRELETVVALYEPAIPRSTRVLVSDVGPMLAFFPDGDPKPDLTGVDLSRHVAAPGDVPGAGAVEGGSSTRRAWVVVAIVAVAVVLMAVAATRFRRT